MDTTTAAEQPEQLLTIGEAAKLIGVHPRTLVRWEHDGKTPRTGRTPGGRRRYTRAQALRIREQMTGADA